VTAPNKTSNSVAVRGAILHFTDDPGDGSIPGAFEFYADGILVAEDGYITKLGEARALSAGLADQAEVTDYTGALILPGFVDTHTHVVQADIIASHGGQLLDWLDEYTYPAESAFASELHGRETADFFLDELLRNGTTTAMVLGSVHPASVDAVFSAALERRMRLIAGKVMMDRGCPERVRDTASSSYAESKALIERWHDCDRLQYAVTPRFAVTSTAGQLACAGRLAREHPGVLVQTHLAENEEEVALVAELFPDRRSYLDVYDHFGLVGEHSVLAHGIWLDDEDLARLVDSGAAIAHCPTCNLFMGSGLLDLDRLATAGVSVGLGTDIGGGTTFSMLRVMHEAYKVAQLAGKSLSPLRAWYLATLAGARALHLDARIGNFLPGKEADFVVLDPHATPLLKRRMERAETLADKLFVLMMLGDDRAVAATYLMGERVRDRGTEVTADA
jgi:guanine deaminase